MKQKEGQIHSEQWLRLSEVIRWTGLSIHAFAGEVGLKRSENLYRIKNNLNGMSRKLVIQVTNRYPEISDVWLMTGAGDMLSKNKLETSSIIPYYHLGVPQYLENPDDSKSGFSAPSFINADLAIDVMTSDLNEIIPAGSSAFLKKISIDNILFGKPYYVVTEHFQEFRIITRSDKANIIKLCSLPINQMNETLIKTDDIKHIFKVEGFFKKI